MEVAAVQLNISDYKYDNIKKVMKYIELAAINGAEVVVLPEYIDYMGNDEEKLKLSEPIPGPLSNQLSSMAKKHQIYLLAGSFHEKYSKTHVYNTSLLFNPAGEIIGKYRKIHLYDACFENRYSIKESDVIKAGNRIVTCPTSFGVMGMTICYDVRFPELFRSLALLGSKVIFVPAAFPLYTGAFHWETLLKARAIENQCYIVAAGQFGGTPLGNMQYGNSMIIDPWGTVLARAPEKEAIIMAELDFSYMEEVKSMLPINNHLRPEVYSELLLKRK